MEKAPQRQSNVGSFIEPLEARIAPATFLVTNTKDEGPGSLRVAIEDANAAEGVDEILFKKGLSGTVKLKSDLPAITDSVTISGPGASKMAVNGNSHQLFKIVGEGLEVSMSGLKLTGGQAAKGGAVYINNLDGTVTLSKTVITKNTAAVDGNEEDPAGPGMGGGVAVTAGSVTIEKSKITGNKAGTLVELYVYGKPAKQILELNGSGGGIAVIGGDVTLKRTAVSGNSAGVGGGIHNAGNLEVADKSKISKNKAFGFYQAEGEGGSPHAGGKGGGIFNTGEVAISASKVTGNQAIGNLGVGADYGSGDTSGGAAFGGGIFNSNQGIIEIISSQVTGNKAVGGKGGAGESGMYAGGSTGGTGGNASGGGIFNSAESVITIVSSKLSGNKAIGGKGGNGGIGSPGEDAYALEKRRGGRGGEGAQGGTGGAAYGGAIANEGAITIEKSKITGNSALGGSGGKGGKGGTGGQGADRVAPYVGYYGKIPGKPAGPGGAGGKGGPGGLGGIGLDGGIHDASEGVSVQESKLSGNFEKNGAKGPKGAVGKQGKSGSNSSGGPYSYYL